MTQEKGVDLARGLRNGPIHWSFLVSISVISGIACNYSDLDAPVEADASRIAEKNRGDSDLQNGGPSSPRDQLNRALVNYEAALSNDADRTHSDLIRESVAAILNTEGELDSAMIFELIAELKNDAIDAKRHETKMVELNAYSDRMERLSVRVQQVQGMIEALEKELKLARDNGDTQRIESLEEDLEERRTEREELFSDFESLREEEP